MKRLHCHPDNIQLIASRVFLAKDGVAFTLLGVPIVPDKNLPRFKVVWQFPRERFFEYEPSDEAWCRYFKIGGPVETDEPVFFMFDFHALWPPITPRQWFAHGGRTA